jgi:hypothetical protein
LQRGRPIVAAFCVVDCDITLARKPVQGASFGCEADMSVTV